MMIGQYLSKKKSYINLNKIFEMWAEPEQLLPEKNLSTDGDDDDDDDDDGDDDDDDAILGFGTLFLDYLSYN